jgi:RNA polymerase sigma-70 factor, ECF subfamily
MADPHQPLIQRIQRGEDTALGELFTRTSARVRGRARAITRDESDADDVTSRVYERAWLHAEAHDPSRGSVMAWLLVICRSTAIDMVRRRKKQRSVEAFATDSITSVHPVEAFVDHEWRDSQIRIALGMLPAERRELLTLAFLEELTHEELSLSLGIPLGTVKSHLRRSLKCLRQQLR